MLRACLGQSPNSPLKPSPGGAKLHPEIEIRFQLEPQRESPSDEVDQTTATFPDLAARVDRPASPFLFRLEARPGRG